MVRGVRRGGKRGRMMRGQEGEVVIEILQGGEVLRCYYLRWCKVV